MKRYTIGQVCSILGVKPHVVRYWEQEIGMLSPTKNLSGRRTYSISDLQLLFRIKHLVQERRYTVGGAAQQILDERSGLRADARARINSVRGELIGLLDRLRTHTSESTASADSESIDGEDTAPE